MTIRRSTPSSSGRSASSPTTAGFLRSKADGTLEWLLTHNTGLAEVWVGTAGGAKIDVSTDAVMRTATAKEVTAGHRLYGLVEGDLLSPYDMAAVGQDRQRHLWGRMIRQ